MTQQRFGKHAPKHDYRTLRLGNYLTPALPPPPPAFDVIAKVGATMGIPNPISLFPMDGNDTYGDCTIAALAHAVTAWRGMIGQRDVMTKAAVVKLYLQLTGGVDSGMNELDVLNFWRKHTISKDKILAYASINPRDHDHVKQAIHLFGGCYLGFQVPTNCMEQFERHETWTPGPLTNDGHAVFAVGYTAKTIKVLTWGNEQEADWSWWDHCVDEAYAILAPESKNPGFAPGFDFAQLQADLAAVAG